MYFSMDSHKLLVFDTETLDWINAGGSSDEIMDAIASIESKVDAINSFEIKVLSSDEELPEIGESHIIYFVPQSNSDDDTKYDEYLWIESESYYEKIGITIPDLSDYYTKLEVDNLVSGDLTTHASTTGSSSVLGHLKLSDATNSSSNTTGGIAATPAAVKAAYDLANGKAATNHASTATTYGIGNSSNYGHLKLSDATDSSSNTTGGIAATPAAVKAAYDLANGKAPTSHASTATTYGIGNSSNYGHTKLSDTYNSSVGDASNGLAASQKALYNVYKYSYDRLNGLIENSGSDIISDYGEEVNG
jgi:hypothetical protein